LSLGWVEMRRYSTNHLTSSKAILYHSKSKPFRTNRFKKLGRAATRREVNDVMLPEIKLTLTGMANHGDELPCHRVCVSTSKR
jgi:predicted metal-dependent RNase